MTQFVMRILPMSPPVPDVDIYLESYDPDFVPPPPEPRYPSGMATWTDDVTKAMHFDSPADGWTVYSARSSTVPLRPDFEWNRPLCGFTVEMVAV